MVIEGTAATRCILFVFFNDTATTEIYTLSLHDALPIYHDAAAELLPHWGAQSRHHEHQRAARRPSPHRRSPSQRAGVLDRKSTRLNSSHANISYAVFCLKKKTITSRSLVDIYQCRRAHL